MTTVKLEPMFNDDVLKGVDLLKLVVQSSFGPNGKLKMLQNNCGGHATLTSASCRLLKTISIANPINKIIASAAQTHLKCHGNDGLYFVLVITELLRRMQNLEISKPVLLSVFRNVTQAVFTHLKECNLKMKVDFSNIALPMALLHSVLRSKPACGISEKQRNHLAGLLMKGFLDSIPQPDDNTRNIGNVYFTTHSGMSPENCKIFSGIFVEIYDTKSISVSGEHLKCALFHVSLSGDFQSDLNDADWTFHYDINPTEMCTARILELCEKLVIAGISLVGCQKVIHPKAKKYLSDHGVLALDRLGLLTFDALLDYTGATPLETFLDVLDQQCFGIIDKISILSENKKTYYHFQNFDSLVSTVFLYNYQEEGIEELLVTCQQAVGALRGLLSMPYVFIGGGCLETHLAAYARHWGDKRHTQLMESGASKVQILTIIEMFANSLESIAKSLSKRGVQALVDEWHHLRLNTIYNSSCFDIVNTSTSSCECGLMVQDNPGRSINEITTTMNRLTLKPAEFDEWKESFVSKMQLNSLKVVDAALSKGEALKSALETFLVLLNIDNVIKTEHHPTSLNKTAE